MRESSERGPLANSQGQSLHAHSVLVGRVAEDVVRRHYPNLEHGLDGIARTALIAGCLHDIGKLDPIFQDYMRDVSGAAGSPERAEDGDEEEGGQPEDRPFSFEDYPRHQEVSWVLLRRHMDTNGLRKGPLLGDPGRTIEASRFGQLEHAIYWHHPRPFRFGEVRERFADMSALTRRLDAADVTGGVPWEEADASAALRSFLSDVDGLLGDDGIRLSDCLLHPDDLPMIEPIGVPAFKVNYLADGALSQAGADARAAVRLEAHRTLVRSALVTADRRVSRLSAEEVDGYLDSGTLPEPLPLGIDLDALHDQFDSVVNRYATTFPGVRTDNQSAAARKLVRNVTESSARVVCLQGPAGCGKTKIALEYLSRLGARRPVVVVVPRTAVGEGLFDELVRVYRVTANVEYLSGSTRLFHSANADGPVETPARRERTGDVLITTVDQICTAMLSHERVDFVTRLASSDVIVDEFHELSGIPAISTLFEEMMVLRRASEATTLLVSATPDRYVLDELEVEKEDVISVPAAHDRPYLLRIESASAAAYDRGHTGAAHPFLAATFDPKPGAFVVCNSATLAQQGALVRRERGDDVVCLHGRFTDAEKRSLLTHVLGRFGRAATTDGTPATQRLIAGPIVQASLNISTPDLHTEATTAENLLQRIGRANRFGEHERATVTVHLAFGSGGRLANHGLLGHLRQRARADAFAIWLLSRMRGSAGARDQDGILEVEVTLELLYRWYAMYQATPEARAACEEDFELVRRRSVLVFDNNDFDPVAYPSRRRRDRTKPARLSANSLRGRSAYVLPLLVDVSEEDGTVKSSLLWTDESAAGERLTAELVDADERSEIGALYLELTRSAGAAATFDRTLIGDEGVAFLERIARATRSVRKWSGLRSRARDPDVPVVVSAKGRHDGYLYYVRYRGLALGLMSPRTFDAASKRSLASLLGRSSRSQT